MHEEIIDELVLVRKAEEKDAEAIVAFNVAMALETEGKVLDPSIVSAGVMGLLLNSAAGFYVVVEMGGSVSACLMITTEWSDWRNNTFWWIQSVYVHEDFRRRGLYRSLYNFVRDLAQQDGGVCGFRLYVERNNQKAQDTYLSLGMHETHYKIFEEKIFEEC